MSIIERALGKLHNGIPAEKVPTQPDRTRRGRDPIVSVADVSRPHREPRASIAVDLDNLRALGVVPSLEDSDRLRDQFRRVKRMLLETVAEHVAGISGASNAFHAASPNLLMVTSAISGEGKTYMAFNLAQSIARERDYSVLLVDADVAKRHMTEVLALDNSPGITDSVADETLDPEDLVLGTGIPGLTFLPAGRQTSVAPELFSSHRMAQIVSRLGLADRQRIVLFDSAPLLATNESPLLARLVDQIVLVVCAESTQQPLVLEAVQLLDKTKTIRCVLNQSRVSSLSEHYYGYYGYPYPAHERPKAP